MGSFDAERSLALPGLRSGVINLEDVHVRIGVAQREGVETGAEDERLSDIVAANAFSEDIFGEASAADHEGAQGCGEWLARGSRCALEFEARLGREDGDGEGIFEDERAGVMQLVRGSAHGDTKGGA